MIRYSKLNFMLPLVALNPCHYTFRTSHILNHAILLNLYKFYAKLFSSSFHINEVIDY